MRPNKRKKASSEELPQEHSAKQLKTVSSAEAETKIPSDDSVGGAGSGGLDVEAGSVGVEVAPSVGV